MTTLHWCVSNSGRTWNLINHHFIIVPSLDMELHTAVVDNTTNYQFPLGHTKDYRIIQTAVFCDACLDSALRIMSSTSDYVPYTFGVFNCESATRAAMGNYPAIGYQTICAFLILVFILCSYSEFRFLTHHSLIMTVLYVWNNISPALYEHVRCKHIEPNPWYRHAST